MQGSFVKHFLILASGTLANMVLGLLTTPIITRLVNPTAYGQYSMFMVYGSIVLAAVGLGLDQALIRFFYTNESKEYRWALLRFCYVIPNLVFCGIVGIALLVGTFSFDAVELLGGPAMSVVFILYVFSLILNRNAGMVLRLDFKTKRLSLSSVLNKAVFAGLSIVLLLAFGDGEGYMILSFSLLLGTVVVAVYQIASDKERWTFWKAPKGMLSDAMEIVKYGAPYIFANIVAMIFAASDRLFLDYYCSAAEVGIYAAAVSIVNVFAIINSSFNTLWAPKTIEHFESGSEDKSLYIRGFNIVSIAMVSLGFLIVLFKDVFILLLGTEYRESVCIIALLCFNPILYTISETTVCGIVFMKKSKSHIVVAVLSLLANAACNIAFTPTLGIRGAAIATAISYVVFFATRSIISQRLYPIGFGFGRLAIAMLLYAGFAIWNTFSAFSPLMVLYYVISQVVVILLFKDAAEETVRWIKRVFSKGFAGKLINNGKR